MLKKFNFLLRNFCEKKVRKFEIRYQAVHVLIKDLPALLPGTLNDLAKICFLEVR